jgi:GTP-binding protein
MQALWRAGLRRPRPLSWQHGVASQSLSVLQHAAGCPLAGGVRCSHVGSWRKEQGKFVAHPSQWGNANLKRKDQEGVEIPDEVDLTVFNPTKATGRLAMASPSPYVWGMKGLDRDHILHLTDDVALRANRSLQGCFLPPNMFKFALPSAGVPEVAFAGRSNVGKSTLVGTLINNLKLVRASKEPGCTRTVNYFGLARPPRTKAAGATEVERSAIFLVDLPGYGYARAPRGDVVKWTAAVEGYLTQRDCSVLRRTFILVDGRHGIKRHDIETMKVLDKQGVSHQVVITKADMLTQHGIAAVVEGVMQEIAHRPACYPVVHVVSSKSGQGIAELLDTIYYITGIADGAHSMRDSADF